MRLYMRIASIYGRIPIHKIKFDNRFLNVGQPELRVQIDREYEDYFLGHTPVVTFEDDDGNVIFQAMWSKLNFRWYESDFDKFNGIEIVARDLEVPDVGRMSKEYTQKVLKKYSKISFDKKIPTRKEIREQEKLQELIEKRKREAAPRLWREKRMRMRYYPIFLQSEICCEYYLYYLKTRKSILNKRFIKLFKIKPKIFSRRAIKIPARPPSKSLIYRTSSIDKNSTRTKGDATIRRQHREYFASQTLKDCVLNPSCFMSKSVSSTLKQY